MPASSASRLPDETPEPSPPQAPPLALPNEQPFYMSPTMGILAGNAVTLAGAVFQHWPALPVMLVYWGQSVAIGVINVIRMSTLKDFSTGGLESNGHPVPATHQGAVSTARFFAFHYGAFHLAYAAFLFHGGFGKLNGWTLATVMANVAMFAGTHAWPLVASRGQDYRGKPNLGAMMFYPYLRIIPMHLAIILGTAMPLGALPFFILLKTGADVGMHEVERRLFRGVV